VEIKKFKDLSYKEKLSFSLAIAAFVVGTILTFVGLFINPVGEIDASVITSVGIFLTFAGSILGISTHYSTELDKFKSEIRGEKQ